MDKISLNQFQNFKSDLVTNSFEMLDVNGDKEITEEDLKATNDTKIQDDIKTLLEQEDEDVVLDDNLDLIDIPNTVKTAESIIESTANTINKTVNTNNNNNNNNNIEGYIDVDVTNVDKETLTRLNEMLATINNNISLIQNKQTSVQTEISNIVTEISNLEKRNRELDKLMKPYNEQLETENGNLTKEKGNFTTENSKLESEKTDNLDSAQKTLSTLTDEYNELEMDLIEANDRIIIEQHFQEIFYEHHIEDVTENIIDNYNPETDGDFETYYRQHLSTIGYVSYDNLNGLNAQAKAAADKLNTKLDEIIGQSKIIAEINSRIATIEAKIRTIETNITNIETNITNIEKQIKPYQDEKDRNSSTITSKGTLKSTKETELTNLGTLLSSENAKKTVVSNEIQKRTNGGGMSASEILAQISQAEKDLAKKNNVDLTKCFAAKGKDDNKWHLYMNNGTSIVRKYAKGKGYDIIANGNGYVKNMKEKDGGAAVYHFTEINEDMTDGEVDCKYFNYSTSSPLSFDVDGDGVHTSENLVNFDIDADGEIDTINNSSEWVLAFDKDRNGIAGENGSELFGDNTDLDGDGLADGYKDGFEALKALAKQENLIGENDNILDENDINKLTTKFGLTMTNGYGGEAKSLSELGITQINLADTNETELTKNFDGMNNDIMTQEGATFIVNGQTREYADIWHSKKEPQEIPQAEKASEEIKKSATTNKEGLTLTLNKHKVVALEGKVDYKKILNKAKEKTDIPDEVQEKIDEYEKKKKEQEEKNN